MLRLGLGQLCASVGVLLSSETMFRSLCHHLRSTHVQATHVQRRQTQRTQTQRTQTQRTHVHANARKRNARKHSARATHAMRFVCVRFVCVRCDCRCFVCVQKSRPTVCNFASGSRAIVHWCWCLAVISVA